MLSRQRITLVQYLALTTRDILPYKLIISYITVLCVYQSKLLNPYQMHECIIGDHRANNEQHSWRNQSVNCVIAMGHVSHIMHLNYTAAVLQLPTSNECYISHYRWSLEYNTCIGLHLCTNIVIVCERGEPRERPWE